MATEIATAYVKLIPSFKGAKSAMMSELNGMAGASGKSAGGLFGQGLLKGGAAIGIFSALANKAFTAVSNSISGAVNRVDTLNAFPKVMKSMGHGATEVSSAMDMMIKGIDGLPTSLDSITSSVQQLTPITGNLEKATKLGIAFNNMALASGSSMDGVTRAGVQFNQMMAKGKVDMQSWQTLMEVMPGQLDQVAKSMLGSGAGARDLYAALQSGKVTTNDFMDAIMRLNDEGGEGFESFANQAIASTGGIRTGLAIVSSAVQRLTASFLNGIGVDKISRFFVLLRDKIMLIQPAFSYLGQMVGTVFSNIISAMEGSLSPLDALKNTLNELFSNIKTDSLTLLESALKSIGVNIAALQPVVDRMSTYLDRAKNALSQLSPQAMIFSAAFVALVPAIAAASSGLTGFIMALVGAKEITGIGAAITSVAKAMTGIGTVASGAGLAGFANSIGSIVTAVQIASSPMELLQMGLTALKAAFAGISLPITAAVAAIAAIGASMAYMYTTNEQFRESVNGVLAGIMAGLAPALDALMNGFSSLIEAFSPLVDTIVSTLVPALANIGLAFLNLLNMLAPIVSLIISAVVPVFTTLASVLSGVLQVAITVVSWGLQALAAVFNFAFSAIAAVVTPVCYGIAGVIGAVFPAIQAIILGVANVIKNTIQVAFDFIKAIITGDMNAAQGIISSVTAAIASFWSACWNGVVSAVSGAVSTVLSVVNNLKSSILSVFSGAGSWLVSAGSNLLKGLWNGISNAVGWVISKVQGVGNMIIDAAKSVFGIHSPSRVFRDVIGLNLMEGLAIGVDENAETAINSIDKVSKDIANTNMTASMDLRANTDYMHSTAENPAHELVELIKAGAIAVTLDGRTLVGTLGRSMTQEMGRLQALQAR